MNKRGQAAMEFLMTYGWAILAAVIVVGVLWYMIGNPANLVGNDLKLSPPLASPSMSVSTTQVDIEFRNGGVNSINITSVDVGCGTISPSMIVGAGSLQNFSIPCTLVSGDRLNEAVTISYTTSGNAIVQSATGTISGRVP